MSLLYRRREVDYGKRVVLIWREGMGNKERKREVLWTGWIYFAVKLWCVSLPLFSSDSLDSAWVAKNRSWVSWFFLLDDSAL